MSQEQQEQQVTEVVADVIHEEQQVAVSDNRDHDIANAQKAKQKRIQWMIDDIIADIIADDGDPHPDTILKKRFERYWRDAPTKELYKKGLAIFEMMDANRHTRFCGNPWTQEDECQEIKAIQAIVDEFEQYF